MEKISLSLQVVNQVMAYLGSKPYQEVFGIVEALQNEAKAQMANQAPVDTSATSTEQA
jgi:hypothetical protein